MKIPFLLPLYLTLTAALASASSPSEQIDTILAKSWERTGIVPSAITEDEVFLRRIYLDAIGRIPTTQEAERFLGSKGEDKRVQLIDELLSSEGYVNHFYNYWADILRLNQNQGGGQTVTPYYAKWIRESLESNLAYDQFVRELITAQGKAIDNGAVGYTYRDRGMPLDHMANTVRIFLGTRLECAQCHNHPFDKWTQMDFFKMAGFSYGMTASNRGGSQSQRNIYQKMRSIDPKLRRDYQRAFQEVMRPVRAVNSVSYTEQLPKLPHDYQYSDASPKSAVEPAAMFTNSFPLPNEDASRPEVYAAWMTAPKNPRFTTVIANRLWKKAMGQGLIEPVDEFTDLTKPSNPELLTYLEGLMRESGYDMKGFLRAVFNSTAYQREAESVEPTLDKPHHFAGPLLRRMTAEQIWDSVVTLVNPNPEMSDWRRDQQFELRQHHTKMLSDAVGKVSDNQLWEYTKRIAKFQKQLSAETMALQKKITAARKANDQQKVRDLSREAGRIRSQLRQKVQQMVYDPALKKGKTKTVAFQLPDGDTMDLSPKTMMGENGQPTRELRSRQSEIENAMIDREVSARGITDPSLVRRFTTVRKNGGRYLRASFVPTPAPRGHFLREFGQSDRETIENGSDEASVPQALNLMNGRDFPAISGSNSILMWNVNLLETTAEKLDQIYLSLLTRKPTAEEKRILASAMEARGEEITQDVVFALLNSPEFLFVQ